MVTLPAAMGDLERADSIAKTGAAGQWPAALKAVQQGGTKGIAASRRVHDGVARDTRDGRAFTLMPQLAP